MPRPEAATRAGAGGRNAKAGPGGAEGGAANPGRPGENPPGGPPPRRWARQEPADEAHGQQVPPAEALVEGERCVAVNPPAAVGVVPEAGGYRGWSERRR